jgi:hypothetical protein
MDMERFYLKKLNEGEVKEQYQVTIKKEVCSLENLQVNCDINRAFDTVRKNIKLSSNESIGYCESKYHKSRGLMRNIQNWLIEGSRLNYSGCSTQVK